MINSLTIENFRGFDRHELPFRQNSIVVGKNNAGKSTIVEALRLISIVTGRYRNLSYRSSPGWTHMPKRNCGVSPSLKGLGINFSSLFYRYGDPPARVLAQFTDGSSVDLYVQSEDEVFAVLRDSGGELIKSRAETGGTLIEGRRLDGTAPPLPELCYFMVAALERRT